MKMIRLIAVITTVTLLLRGSNVFSAVPDSLKSRIDSLMHVASVSEGLQRYQAEFKIAWDLFDIDNEMAVSHAAVAYSLVVNGTDTMKIIRSGRLYAQLLRRTDKLNESTEVFLNILPLAETIPGQEQMGKILYSLAIAYNFQGRFDQALSINLKSLRLALGSGDSVRIGNSYLGAGLNYYYMGYFPQAAAYFEKATKLTDSVNVAYGLVNLGLVKLYLNEVSAYPVLARRGLLHTPAAHVKSIITQYEWGYGLYFFKLGLTDSAEHHYQLCLSRSKELVDARMIADSKIGIAECDVQRGDFGSAIRRLKEVEQELSSLQYSNVRARCYSALSSALRKSKKWEEALMYTLKHVSLDDSLRHEQVQNNFAMERTEFEERENELRLLKQAQVIELNHKVMAQQRALNVVSVSLAIVLTGLVFLFYRFNSYQKGISAELDKKVVERTRDLKKSESALAMTLAEQRELMRVVSQKVKSSIATFRGLWTVGGIESPGLRGVSENLERTANELLWVSSIVDRSSDLRKGALDRTDEMSSEYSTEAFADTKGNGPSFE